MIRTSHFHRMILYAEEALGPFGAKTAHCLARYRPRDVVAVLDSTRSGTDLSEWYGFGHGIPVISAMQDAWKFDPDSFVIGLAPRGGRLGEHALGCVGEAIDRGLAVISGMHTFLSDDEELVRRAERSGAAILDLRRVPEEFRITSGLGFAWPCPVVLTVGTDCNVGKMTAAYEIARKLESRGFAARFAATGQTGILLSDGGIAIDRVIADFVGGAAEALVASMIEGADVVVVEGQGSIYHPAYAGVTLGLMLGVLPDGLVLCHHAGRKSIEDYPVSLPPLVQAIEDHENLLRSVKPARVLCVAVNDWESDVQAVEEESKMVRRDLGIPVGNVLGNDLDQLADAVEILLQADGG